MSARRITCLAAADTARARGRAGESVSRWGRRLTVIVLLAVTGWVLGAGVAVAVPVEMVSVRVPVRVPVQVVAQVLAQPASVDEVLTRIRNWIMGIAFGLATVFGTIGAVYWISAGGDLGQLEKARTAFRSAGYGYALALLTPLLLSVLRDIFGA